ncbi:hypothetical protein, partial [Klebsiella pneumoniae]|uniref:hypothetical protein n=1 Tax=Klebsiella pneumoniae TaxID=573 RepID=UPI001BA7FF2C
PPVYCLTFRKFTGLIIQRITVVVLLNSHVTGKPVTWSYSFLAFPMIHDPPTLNPNTPQEKIQISYRTSSL